MATLNLEESVRQQWRKKRRKKDMIFLLVIAAILIILGITIIVHSLLLMKSKYEAQIDAEESIFDAYEPEMVSLEDIPDDPPKEESLKSWGEKSKLEKYEEDISESLPEETLEVIEPDLKDQELVEAINEDILKLNHEDRIEMGKVWDVALPAYLQFAVIGYCEEYEVPPALVMSLMETESTFREDVGTEKVLGGTEGGPRYYGYMQLSASNCKRAETQYGLDAHTPEGNIEMGIIYLHELYLEKQDWAAVIKAYKGGGSSKKVMEGMKKYE